MKVTKAMRDGEHLVEFKVPVLGNYSIGWDAFKYVEPFSHYTEKEKEADRRERSKRPKYTVWHNGGGIAGVNDLEEGRRAIRKHAEGLMQYYLEEAEVRIAEVVKLREAMKVADWLAVYSK